ncbi:MAG TPA: MoaD/ThiS family protein [Anaerolineaceae bacterium]|nr:MoaD/ThiS family protein [Anaerolineaceae bacterium]
MASIIEAKSISLVIEDDTTYAGLIQKLGKIFPPLIGVIIDQDGKTMLSSNMFLVNGQDFVMNGMFDQSPNDRDHLTLISPTTGG